MIVELNPFTTKQPQVQQSRQNELSSSLLGDLDLDSENMSVVGFLDCPINRRKGVTACERKTFQVVYSNPMTGNLGSVKLSQLDHGSHCLPFPLDFVAQMPF
jgi:hypothetical protein